MGVDSGDRMVILTHIVIYDLSTKHTFFRLLYMVCLSHLINRKMSELGALMWKESWAVSFSPWSREDSVAQNLAALIGNVNDFQLRHNTSLVNYYPCLFKNKCGFQPVRLSEELRKSWGKPVIRINFSWACGTVSLIN